MHCFLHVAILVLICCYTIQYPGDSQDITEDSSFLEPTSDPVESDEEMATSETEIPTSDDVYEEEEPEESNETETEDEAKMYSIKSESQF